MKSVIIAAGLALLTLAGPANASWAENANMRQPVYTGTDQSLARAQYGARHYSRRIHRSHRWHRHWR